MEPADVARFWEANTETWTSHARRGLDVHRDALNTPASLAMLPTVAGMHGLDIGCGEGAKMSLRSSIWVQTASGWRMLFHQGTLAG